jgi:hypothetical protein
LTDDGLKLGIEVVDVISAIEAVRNWFVCEKGTTNKVMYQLVPTDKNKAESH